MVDTYKLVDAVRVSLHRAALGASFSVQIFRICDSDPPNSDIGGTRF